MQEKIQTVWLICKRELRDQLRDWRILAPLLILTLGFPFFMNGVAHQAVTFVNKYGGDIIVDRLIPFSILIIGFFPLTVSLLGALESFVGEKERGTIEPLLASPLEDWQMYMGKLAAGILPPVLSSLTSISIFLVLVSRQALNMPALGVILQLLFLTVGHAVLMVSAAVVFSIQSTSVKAANLLASFIVIPVTLLMQGESWILFWNNEAVMWLVVAGVLIIAGLLVRLGLAHFQREYLLGREFDALNIGWLMRTFWRYFRGGAHSLRGWYRDSLSSTLKKLIVPTLILMILSSLTIAAAYQWTNTHLPQLLADMAKPENASKLDETLGEALGIESLADYFNAPTIFSRNLRGTVVIALFGIFSFGVLGVLGYLFNMSLIGALLGAANVFGFQPAVLFVAGILPHGIFELPAVLLSSAAVFHIGLALVTPQAGRTIGEVFIEALAEWFRVVVGLVIPMLAIAALIEVYITPQLLCRALDIACIALR